MFMQAHSRIDVSLGFWNVEAKVMTHVLGLLSRSALLIYLLQEGAPRMDGC